MRYLAIIALVFAASGAQATEYCLVKRNGGEAQACYTSLGQCESKADRMTGWKCEKR